MKRRRRRRRRRSGCGGSRGMRSGSGSMLMRSCIRGWEGVREEMGKREGGIMRGWRMRRISCEGLGLR